MFESLAPSALSKNEAQNPNSKANQAGNRLEAGLETFLKLLTQQFQHQDPTSPMDTNQFTEQLVQLTVAEQSVNTNKNLEALIEKQENFEHISSLALIGKNVKYEGGSFAHQKDGVNKIEYEVPEKAKSLNLIIVDDKGAAVANLEGKTEKGTQQIIWDGKNNQGEPADSGSYEVRILSLDEENNILDIKTSIYAQVNGVKFENGKNIAMIHNEKVDLSQITEVFQ